MRSGLSFKALVPVVALLLTSSAFGQEEIAPNANDIAMGADPSEPLIAIPAAWIPAGISVKRSEVTANDKHLLTKRHYGVFECAQQLNDYCKTFLTQTGVCDANGANCLVGCADNDQGKDTCWVGCQTGYDRSTTSNNPICIAKYPSDVNNCGAQGNSCIKNAGAGYLAGSAKCSNGVCSVSCQSGYTLNNGVCTSAYLSDVANCGAANNNCANNAGAGYLAGSAKCSNGVCSVSCQSGYTNTNGVCVSNYNNDPLNCGAANNNCATKAGAGYLAGSAKCSNGICSISCSSGYSAVNGVCVSTCKDGSTWDGTTCNRYTGCSTAADCVTQTGNSASYCYLFPNGNYCFTPSSNARGLPAGSTCGKTSSTTGDDNSCASGLVCINYVCSSPFAADPYNCGKQGNICPTATGATSTCVNGSCSTTCASGLTKTSTGCVDLTSDESNCGKISTVCASTPNGAALCQNSVCTIQCNPGYTLSGLTCVSTTNDVNNCGQAGRKCPVPTGATSATCVASSCGWICPAGWTKTTTGCVDTTSDKNNCGAISQQCPVPAGATSSSCTLGKCTFVCGPGYIVSGSTCALDTSSDPNNCGGSKIVCPTDPNGVTACSSSACQLTCNTGYIKSGTKCVPNTISQCGSATNVCTAPKSHGKPVCNGSTCSVTCDSGYIYNAATNDCVASNTPTSCGPNTVSCPKDPNGVSVCVGGVCGLDCNNGYYFLSATVSCVAANTNTLNTDTSCGIYRQNCLTTTSVANTYTYCALQNGAYKCFASCNPGYILYNGACVPLATDMNNCGTKGTVCSATGTGGTATCQTGICQITCPSGQDYDGTKCIDTTKDPNNCSGSGLACTAPANSYATCSSSKCGFVCNAPYTKTADGTACVDYTSNPSACGAPPNTKICSSTGAGIQSVTCVQGRCSVSCLAGFLSDGAGGCKADTSSDVTNCGGNGPCPTDPNGNGTPFCSASKCGLTCTNGAVYSATSKSCIPNSPSACGSAGTQCKSPVGGNGTPVCNSGVCSVQCDAPRTYNAATNTCDLANTPSSCGPLGINCPSDPAGKGTAQCTAGTCSLSCPAGYVYSPTQARCIVTDDPNSCGYTLIRYKCVAPANGQATCQLGQCGFVCNAGYTASGSLSVVGTVLGLGSAQCTSITSDPNNCGALNKQCPTVANGQAVCTSSSCSIQCNTGYDYDRVQNKCISITGDLNNCGFVGNRCFAPTNGLAQCQNSLCKFTCNTGYVASGASCVLSGSAKARTKKRSKPVVGLCPAGETACPIAGSNSFRAFNTSSNKRLDFAGAAGGFECLDTRSSLESCGGCASTGEGKDCTTIPHSAGVGCSAGQCVVFSCEPGYVASLNSAKCLKIHTSSRRHGKGVSSNVIH